MPVNCRRFLEILLGVPERLRRKPRAALHKAMMERLWPEVMSQAADLGRQSPLRRAKTKLMKSRNHFRQGLRLIQANAGRS